MIVAICTRCELLLMRLVTIQHSWDELNLSGEYKEEGNPEYDYSLCLCCEGTDSSGAEYQRKHPITLKELELPDSLVNPLKLLWKKEQENNKRRKNKIDGVRYGIPLSNKELKRLLVEYLI